MHPGHVEYALAEEYDLAEGYTLTEAYALPKSWRNTGIALAFITRE